MIIFFSLFAALSLEEKLSQSLKERPNSPVIIQNNDFTAPGIVWYGLPKEGKPNGERTLFVVLKEKQEEYKKRDFSTSTTEPSHLVARVGNYFLKFLNLIRQDGVSDENADNEVICHALYKTLGIDHLSPKVRFAYLDGPDENGSKVLVQITEAIEGSPFSSETTPSEESYSFQYLMSLILALPDAKKPNIIVRDSNIVFIDKEMAFNSRTVYRPGRNFVPGVYSALFRHSYKDKGIHKDVYQKILDIAEQIKNSGIELLGDLFRILGGRDDPVNQTLIQYWYRHIKTIVGNYSTVINFTEPEQREKIFWKMTSSLRELHKLGCIIRGWGENEKKEKFYNKDLLSYFYGRLSCYFERTSEENENFILFQDADTQLTSYPEEKEKRNIRNFLKDLIHGVGANKFEDFVKSLKEGEGKGVKELILGDMYETFGNKQKSDEMYKESHGKGCFLGTRAHALSKSGEEKFNLLKEAADKGSEAAARSYANYLAYSRDSDKGPKKAIEFLENWLKKFPPNFHVYDLLGSIYTTQLI